MNTTLRKLMVMSMLSCVGIAARAENVLYIHPLNDSSTESAEAFGTKNYAFADKITTSVSVALWVKDMTGRGDRIKCIAGVPGFWELLIPASKNDLQFKTQSGSIGAGRYVVNDGNWHFIVGTFNYDSENAANSFQCLYVDGSLVSNRTDITTAIGTPDKMFSLGGQASNMSSIGSFNWLVNVHAHFAELSVWNRALSATEVSDLYTQTTRLVGNESGLVAYWPLTGTPGMAATDYSFPNLAATSGVPNLTSYWTALGYTTRVAIEADDGFAKPYVRFVASPEWCAEHSYVQQENATGRSWADPLTNLAAVAAAAKSHERILCSPGTHRIESSISPLVTYFNLGSQDPATGEPCPDTAIIDAQELCRHFISTSDTTGHQSGFTVENLTFVNGRESSGGSMYFKAKEGLINNCIFHDNAATNGNGGAYYAYTVNGTIVSNCVFYGNRASQNGGAVHLTQNETASEYHRFVDCVFTNNTSTASSSSYGGGAVNVDRKVELENCLFAGNGATSGMGGHVQVGVNSILNGCVFSGKCRANYGSCLAIRKNPVVVTNCVFRNLTVSDASSDFIRFVNSGTGSSFVDCVFTNNANVTTLFYQNSKNLLFRQCLIADNASGQAVVPNLAGSTVFENCTIAQAIVTPATVSTATTNTFINCIMPNATITSSGNYCNILSNCLVKVAQGGPFDSGVITGNPKFTDAANGDYTLMPGSQCREQGLTLSWMTNGSTDLLGNPRVVDLNAVAFSPAALPDLGCYECQESGIQPTVMSFR